MFRVILSKPGDLLIIHRMPGGTVAVALCHHGGPLRTRRRRYVARGYLELHRLEDAAEHQVVAH